MQGRTVVSHRRYVRSILAAPYRNGRLRRRSREILILLLYRIWNILRFSYAFLLRIHHDCCEQIIVLLCGMPYLCFTCFLYLIGVDDIILLIVMTDTDPDG